MHADTDELLVLVGDLRLPELEPLHELPLEVEQLVGHPGEEARDEPEVLLDLRFHHSPCACLCHGDRLLHRGRPRAPDRVAGISATYVALTRGAIAQAGSPGGDADFVASAAGMSGT